MPRVNNIYVLPPNSYGTPGGTIESAKYALVIDDLAADANNPRPVGAGGTGVASIAEFKTALNYTFQDIGAGAAKGGIMSAVKVHGSLGAVTEDYKFADGNVHSVTVAAGSGTHTINPTGLVEGASIDIDLTWVSGAFVVSGVTEWIVGGAARDTNFGNIGVVLVQNKTYLLVLKMLSNGTRVGAIT